MRTAIEQESKEKAGWMECFNPRRKQLYRTLLCMTLQMFQQLTGANYFFYYGTTIFQGAGISDSFITQVILGAVNFGTTFGGLYVVENFGRRKSLIFGAGWMFVMFMIFSSLGHFMLDVENSKVEHHASWPGEEWEHKHHCGIIRRRLWSTDILFWKL